MQFRHELKYIVNYAEYASLRVRLAALMRKDSHVNSEGYYTVRSLYFDDYRNSAYHEKYFGIQNRQKYRIRIYNYSDQVIHLERKLKRDRYVYKQSAPLTRSQVNEILMGNYDCLRECDDPLHLIFYHECRSNLMRPRVIVDYEREPYVMDAGDVRITFDQHVRVGVDGWDLFNDKMATVELFAPSVLVMEVKYTEFLPSIIRGMLPRTPSEYSAVSKYVMGCDQTLYKRLFDN